MTETPSAPIAPWLDLRLGDALTVLKTLPERSVSCCVTSPPYWGLRDYGNEPLVWGGMDHPHVWADPVFVNATNHTDKRRWQHTRNGRDEEQPTEKRVAWLRTEVGHGQFCACGAWRGSLGLEPTPELYTEHLVEVFREVRRVLRDDGTLWLNLGDCWNAYNGGAGPGSKLSKTQTEQRPDLPTGYGLQCKSLKPKDLIGIPWRAAFALQEDGWWLRSDIVWSKPNPMPESVSDRPTKAHEYVFLLAKSERYYYDAAAVAEPAAYAGPNGNQLSPYGQGFTRRSKDEEMARQRTKGEAHFATFPTALVKPCIWAGAPEGGVVLDPFLGSGTTAMIAKELGRRALGIEFNPSYLELARKRCGQVTLWEVETRA